MRVLSQRERIIFIACCLFVGVFIVVQFVVKPFQEGKNDMEIRTKSAQLKLAKARQVLRKSQQLEAQFEKYKDVLGISSLQGKEVSLMMSKLETAAANSSVHIANMQPLRGADKGIYSVFLVEITFDGTWDAVTRFLYVAQDKSNLFKIDELNLERYSDAAGSLRGRAVLSRIRVNSKDG